jgi:hypothetical protein
MPTASYGVALAVIVAFIGGGVTGYIACGIRIVSAIHTGKLKLTINCKTCGNMAPVGMQDEDK